MPPPTDTLEALVKRTIVVKESGAGVACGEVERGDVEEVLNFFAAVSSDATRTHLWIAGVLCMAQLFWFA